MNWVNKIEVRLHVWNVKILYKKLSEEDWKLLKILIIETVLS